MANLIVESKIKNGELTLKYVFKLIGNNCPAVIFTGF